MRQQANPVVWLAWGAAVTMATITTRNPLYLTLTLLAAMVTHIACRPESAGQSVWGLVIKIGGLVAVASIAFNLLTAHAGNDVLFRISNRVPIVGGDITANALLYGVSSALAIFTLIVAAATFASVVDRMSLLSLVPAPLASAGLAAVIGLSFFPQTLSSLRQVREAQAARGFGVRSVRDVAPLVVPVLSLGLEGAFDLAEAMESRAFGGTSHRATMHRWVFPLSALLVLGSIASMIGGFSVPAVALGILGPGCAGIGLLAGGVKRDRYRPLRWTVGDSIVAVAAVTTFMVFAGAVIVAPHLIEWSPFPMLGTPPFSLLVGAACLFLSAPALLLGRAS